MNYAFNTGQFINTKGEAMLEYIMDFGGEVGKLMGNLDRNQWIMVFFGIVVVGFFCMRGFGSRTNY